MRYAVFLSVLVCVAAAGCGTTRWTDTARTATEQLLISDAIDRAVSQIDVRPLAGQSVYLDAQFLQASTDKNYTTSVLRQHLLASGCRLADKKTDAEYIVEARAGAVGTSRHDLLYGIPSTDLSSLAPVPGVPNRIPEIPVAKKTQQRGSAKIAVFAYHRETGMPFWQSGNAQVASTAKDIWVLGIGPFERGNIRDQRKPDGEGNALTRWVKGDKGEDKIWVAESLQFHTPQSIRHAQQLDESTRQAQLPAKPGAAKPAPAKPPAKAAAPAPAGPPPAPPLGSPTATATRATINGVNRR